MSICVLDSLNIDLVMRSPRLPCPGETLSSHGFEIIPGGKGANQEAGVFVILDPAPVPNSIPTELYQYIDVLTPNRTEAERLVKFPIQSIVDAEHAALTLQKQGVKHVILKMGGQGAIALIDNDIFRIPAFPVDVVDSNAAGDAFNGALAAALDQSRNWSGALHWATAAGALATTRFGAHPSLPTYETLSQLLQNTEY